MKKYSFLLILFLAALVSCEKELETKKVDYYVRDLHDPFTIVYINAEGQSVKETVTPVGGKVIKTFEMEQGAPVYLYATFTEDVSNSMQFSVGILVNGKYEYQARFYDRIKVVNGDTTFEVKRAGVVPFD
jgi:hypothetical protein